MRRHLALAALLAGGVGAGAACDPRLYHDAQAEAPPPPPPTSKVSDEPPPSPSPFGLLGMLNKTPEPGPFDEPRESAAAKDAASYAAILELRGRVVELDAPFSFSLSDLGGGAESIGLRALTDRLGALEADAKVAAIVLRLGDLSLSFAAAEELRAKVAASQKISCHAERLGNATMLVASACKKLALEPSGDVAVMGPAAVPLYFKGLLDKLNLQADFLHMGAYKGAAEPLTRSEPSPEMRQTYGDLLDGAHGRLLDALVDGRRATRADAEGWIDRGLFSAEAARAAGLVDAVTSWSSFRDQLAPGGAWKKVKVKEGGGGMDEVLTLLGLKPRKRVRGPHVALMYAVGEVVEGRGGAAGAFENISSGRLAPAIAAAAADPAVRAIVLRVDSPGGSALASEVIEGAVHDAALKKPVVVSMGALAASGGYYISTPAARIFAQPDTLTGSIGVVGGKIVIGAGLAKLGIHAEEIGRGKHALIYSAMRPWSDDERAVVRGLMEDTYTLFKTRVAEGRKIPVADVEKHAQGRVFTGEQAKERGLVDELGGLDAALAYARRKANLDVDDPVEVYPGEPTLLELLGSLGGGGVRVGVAPTGLAAEVAALAPALDPRIAGPLRAALDLVSSFQRDRVRLVAFLPVIE